MKKIFIYIISVIILSVNLLAFSPNAEFKKANDFFNAGKYSDAAQVYNSLLDSGYKSSEIYYNLGNTYFRLENTPLAILNFERAKRLSPNDDDINFNRQIANLRIVDKFDPVPKFFIYEWFDDLLELMYSGVWGIVTVSACWVFCISLLLLFFSNIVSLRRTILAVIYVSFFAIFISGFMGYKAFENENANNQAIIFKPSVYVKSAPDPGSTDLFILHEGTKVIVLENIDKWLQIRLENGNIGWIMKNEIEII